MAESAAVEVSKNIFIFNGTEYIQRLAAFNELNCVGIKFGLKTNSVSRRYYIRFGFWPKSVFTHRNIGKGNTCPRGVSFNPFGWSSPEIGKIYSDRNGIIGFSCEICSRIEHPWAFIQNVVSVHFRQLSFSGLSLPSICLQLAIIDRPIRTGHGENNKFQDESHSIYGLIPLTIGAYLWFFGRLRIGRSNCRIRHVAAFFIGCALMAYGIAILI